MDVTKISKLMAVVLVVLLAGGGFYFFQQSRTEKHVEAAQAEAARAQQVQQNEQKQREQQARLDQQNPEKSGDIATFRTAFFGSISGEHISSSAHQAVRWHGAEVERHRQSLGDAQYDLIVLPVDEDEPSNDRVGRLMAARWIADTIEQSSGKRVMPPELAMRLLGGRATHFEDAQAFELAEQVGADLVYLFLASNSPMRQAGSFAMVQTDAQGRILKRADFTLDVTDIALGLETAIARSEPAIGSTWFDDHHPMQPATVYQDAGGLVFPARLTDLIEQADSPLDHAMALQLLAMLTPTTMEYERRRLFERSLVALRAADPKSSHYRLLMARAYAHLFRRPMALTYLESADSPAEIALREYLNGNYPEMSVVVTGIQEPMLRALAQVELAWLAYTYDKPAPDPEQLQLEAPWKMLFTAAIKDPDDWHVSDNLSFFSALKGLFPAFDSQFSRVIQEQAVSGEISLFAENENLIETVFSRASGKGAEGCCPGYGAKPERADLWLFYRNHGMANLYRNLNRSVNIQGTYETAQALAERIKPLFDGHPTFCRLYGEVLEQVARKKQGAEKSYHLDEAWKLMVATGINSAEVDWDTLRAESLKSRLLAQMSDEKRRSVRAPFHAFAHRVRPSFELAAEATAGSSALPYTNHVFYSLVNARKQGELDEKAFAEQLAGRFNGHPSKPVFVAEQLVKAGKTPEAIALLQSEAVAGNSSSHVYIRLGELLVQAGDYSAAGKAYMMYPWFKDIPDGERVTVSNNAYEWGSKLFWLGHFDEAKPLYELSASLSTGAESQFAAAQRIAMIEQDFRAAMAYAYQRGQRYNSKYGYRDYLLYLNLLDFQDEAETGFRALAPRFDSPQVWTSLFVGQRMQGYSFEDMRQWSDRYLIENGAQISGQQVQRYLLMQSLIDRDPGDTYMSLAGAQAVKATARPIELKSTGLAKVFGAYQQPADTVQANCRPPTTDCARWIYNGPIPDLYQSFSHGHSLLSQERYAEALDVFRQYDSFGDIMEVYDSSGFALSYVAVAAAESETKTKLNEFLAAIESYPGKKHFDNELARAVLYTKLGRLDEALVALTEAYHQRPHTEWRPIFSWYQLTEIAEWMYKISGDRRFVDSALGWAKKYQVIQPHFGWAYAFEALYNPNRTERVRAAAFAAYLDADSAWLNQVADAIRKDGETWWRTNNPYEKIRKNLQQEEPEGQGA